MSRIAQYLPPAESEPPGQAKELRPCPFCGGPARVHHLADAGWQAECADDEINGCLVYAVAGPCETAEEAVAIWNHRGGHKL